MQEQIRSQPTPDLPEQRGNTMPQENPELHFLYNLPDFVVTTNATWPNETLRRLREIYGNENVHTSVAVINGKHVADPYLKGVYVNAEKWAELNPPQETTQQSGLGA